MKANYSSRGYQIYGDTDNVQKDANTIKEILERQGHDLILEVIANQVGNNKIKYSLSTKEIEAVKASLTLSLNELIDERV